MNQQTTINVPVHLKLSDMVPVVFSNSLRQVKWLFVVLGVLILCEAGYLFWLRDFYRLNSDQGINAINLLLLLLVFVLSIPVSLLVGSYFLSRSTLKNNPNFRGDFAYVFSAEGISVQGIHSKGNLSWDGLHHVAETPRAFLLFHDKYHSQVVPKRCFAGEADLVALRALVRAHVQKVNLRAT